MTKEEIQVHGNTLSHWRKNAEDNYETTPISVLKYITCLEESLDKYATQIVLDKLPGDDEIEECDLSYLPHMTQSGGVLIRYGMKSMRTIATQRITIREEVEKPFKELLEAIQNDSSSGALGDNMLNRINELLKG